MAWTGAQSARGRLTTVLLVLALWLWSAASAAADDAAALRVLADAARVTLAERIEPPVAQLPFLCTAGRTETAPLREYILRQQAEATEALQRAPASGRRWSTSAAASGPRWTNCCGWPPPKAERRAPRRRSPAGPATKADAAPEHTLQFHASIVDL